MQRRTTFLITLTLLFNNGLPLITFPILTKTFDIASYGMWIEAGTIVGLIVIFANQGIANALGMSAANISDDARDRLYANALYGFLIISGMLIMAVFITAPTLNEITMRSENGTTLIRIISVQIIFFAINSLLFQVYRMKQEAFKGTLLDASMNVGRLAAVITTLFFKDLILFAIIYVAIQGLITGIQFGLTYRNIRFTSFDISIVKKLARDGFNLSVVSQANWLVMYGDRLMISVMSTSVAVAIYAASYQLTLIVNALGWPHLYVLLPVLGEHWKNGNLSGLQDAVKHTTRIVLLLLMPSAVGLAFIGDQLLSFLATSAFTQGGLLIGMIAVGVTLDVLGTTLQYIFYVQDKPGVLRNIYLKAAVLNLVANLIAIPLFSYNGAGLTTMLTFAFIFYSLWRKTEMPFAALFDASAMWRCAIASGIMAIWVMVTINASLAGLVIAITGGALIYGAAIVTLKVITFDELVAIPRAILRRMRRTQPA